jgi:hypothetical protein
MSPANVGKQASPKAAAQLRKREWSVRDDVKAD